MTLTLVAPSRGHITQWYGARQIDGNPHAGQDYAYTNGREIFPEVYAAADGLVLFAGDARGLAWPNIMYLNPDFDRTDNVDESAGNYTIIAHFDAAGNRIALTGYGHQEEVWVKAGDRVRAGQRIGTVGETGFSAGKHLHFDLVLFPFDVDDAPYYGRVNPNPYIIPGSAGGASVGPAGNVTQEDELSAAEVKEIKDHINAVLLGTFDWDGQTKRPGINKVLIETQNRVTAGLDEIRAARKDIAALPTRIWWGTTVVRDGQEIAVIQDLANGVTDISGQGEVLVEISENVSPEALAALVPEAQAEAFINALRERLAPKEEVSNG